MVVELQIHHLKGSLAGHTQRLALADGQVVTFGRGPGCDIRFHDQHDDLVSTLHARLRVTAGRLLIEDQKSSNGTYLNGTRCPAFEAVAIPDGGRVQFAREGPEFQVLVGGTRAAPAKPAIGPATLRQEIASAIGREAKERQRRRRSAWIAATVLVGVGGLLAGITALRERPEPALAPTSWKTVEATLRPAVARVISQYRVEPRVGKPTRWASASGVLIGPELVLTSFAAAEPWRNLDRLERGELLTVAVQFPGLEPISARLFAVDPELELALVRIPRHPARPVPLARGDAQLAQELAFLLHPPIHARFLPAPGSTLRTGRLGPAPLLLGRVIRVEPTSPEVPRRLELDSVFTAGSGGGPVVNAGGALLGLVRSSLGSADARGQGRIAVTPLASLRRFLNRLALPPTTLAPPQEVER